MKTKHALRLAALVFVILHSSFGILHAQVPQIINYQGRIAVGTVNFNGSGAFKFALVNAAGTTTYWSNDGTSTAGSQPTAVVTLTVTKGLYSVLLGDTSLAGMTSAIPASVWSNADVRLRVWFNDGVNGSQLLSPDQRFAPNGYLPDAGVSNAKLANASVTVTPGTGLTGGGAVALGSAITLSANTGTAANQLVALNGSAQLPAVSGINLTNLNGANLTAASVPLAALGTNSVDSAKIVDGSILNADVNSAAGIAYSKLSLTGSLVNADIATGAGIADTKLATITSAGKVANSATTGSNTNTAGTLVLRDGSGNFAAGTITASLAGNATSATSFSGALAGDVTGTQGVTTVATVGGMTAAGVAIGANLANQATNLNTLSQIVRRDASGNFTAGTITASLAGNATSATTATTAGNVSGTVAIANGGTGATSAAGALTALGAASLAANSFTGAQSLNDVDMKLRGPAGTTSGLGWYGTGKTFALLAVDGPVLYGNTNGVLGTMSGGTRAVLNWSSDGRVGIGFPSPGRTLEVNGGVGGIGAYVNVSDARYKTDVDPIGGALEKITRLRGVTFDWRRAEFPDLKFDKGRQIGFIAQELREVLPEVVSENAKGFLSVAYSEVVPVLVEAVKEQQRNVAAKNAEIDALKVEMAKQKSRLDALEATLLKSRPATNNSITRP